MRKALIFQSSWGWMGISETPKGIDAVVLPAGVRRLVETNLRAMGDGPLEFGDSVRLEATRRQLIEYLDGKRETFDVSLDMSQRSSFRRRVWRVLERVPYGKLRSYQWIAIRVGGSHFARAVGNAVGANPIPILIPCHRIVAQDTSIGGFSCGLSMKRRLLALEGTLRYLKKGR